VTATVIDAHVHFIDPGRLRYPWLEGVLDRPHTPADYAAEHAAHTEHAAPPAAIMVEAGRVPEQAADEISWVRSEAAERPWIRGIVAHADVEDPRADRTLRAYRADPLVVGVRRNLQDEADGFVASAAMLHGTRLLGEYGLPFDACVRARQLPELFELARGCPQTTIVLDHLGKPRPGADYEAWRTSIRKLGALPNVVCKLSGLATEAPEGTPRAYFIETLTYVLEVFGARRCLYGSDWPVVKLATTGADWFAIVREAVERHDAGALSAVMAGNAERFYLTAPIKAETP
jgi:L-fuconolactonase